MSEKYPFPIHEFGEKEYPGRERVWIVWSHYIYDGDHILKIFKTKEEAVEHLLGLTEYSFTAPDHFYEIEEWVLDELED